MIRDARGVWVAWALLAPLFVPALPAQEAPEEQPAEAALTADQQHEALFLEDRFPSAVTCGNCHPTQYRQWSVSPHSYAQMSPVFNAMHGTVLDLTNGTNGDFCIRCHTPVGMNLEEPEFMSNMDRHPTSREGVTCVVCHRLNRAYGKLSGRLAIVEGDIFDPVYGPTGGDELQRVIASDDYHVNAERGRPGRAIHQRAEKFFTLTTPGFCATCHDVNLVNGFRLEEAFSEFKTSPAARQEVSCQDCHMGTDPGKPSGYATGPAAIIGSRPTADRTLTNHMFIGPDYSVVHPGIFPHNTEASEMATIREWLTFDYEAGWGTDAFEKSRPDDYVFPERWSSPDDRYDARDIITANQGLLAEANAERKKVLQAGYQLGELVVDRADRRGGLEVRVSVENATTGHGVPTGFDAERLVFLRATLTDGDGNVVFRTGDLDPNGDVRDAHSLYVHDGELPLDDQLFSLQSKFVTRNLRGGEREQVLAVNYSPDPLPFLRPSTSSTILTGRPRAVRKHKENIEPLGRRWARYRVPPSVLGGAGPYTVRVELVAGMVPVNLIDAIQDVGFDYGMSAREVARRVVDGHLVLAAREASIALGEPAAGAVAPPDRAPVPMPADPMEAMEPIEEGEDGHASRLSDEAIPLRIDSVAQRPKLLLELGNPYLGTGLIKPGKELPNGAVWQPTLIAFGTVRSAVQTIDVGGVRRSEWASRLDLFANLQLTGTERLVVGFRNLDQDGRFTRYTFEDPSDDTGFSDELNAGIETLYFEGDFGEIFPGLDRRDFRRTDVGFSIGRQPLVFQEGMLINDSVDGIGITRNTLQPKGTSNLRLTFFLGLDSVGRANVEDDSASLAAILTSADFRRSTVDVDLAYVRGGDLTGDLAAAGVTAVQRIGTTNTTFRLLASSALDAETAFATDGALLYSELAWTPRHTEDLVYLTTFAAFDEYSAAVAGPSMGGPLGPAGIGFASVGLGAFGAPLSSRARDVAGGALGYQRYFGATRRQLVAELAARFGTASDVGDDAALSLRYQAAFGRRLVLQLDGFGGRRGAVAPGDDDATLWGGRVELRLKF